MYPPLIYRNLMCTQNVFKDQLWIKKSSQLFTKKQKLIENSKLYYFLKTRICVYISGICIYMPNFSVIS